MANISKEPLENWPDPDELERTVGTFAADAQAFSFTMQETGTYFSAVRHHMDAPVDAEHILADSFDRPIAHAKGGAALAAAAAEALMTLVGSLRDLENMRQQTVDAVDHYNAAPAVRNYAEVYAPLDPSNPDYLTDLLSNEPTRRVLAPAVTYEPQRRLATSADGVPHFKGEKVYILPSEDVSRSFESAEGHRRMTRTSFADTGVVLTFPTVSKQADIEEKVQWVVGQYEAAIEVATKRINEIDVYDSAVRDALDDASDSDFDTAAGLAGSARDEFNSRMQELGYQRDGKLGWLRRNGSAILSALSTYDDISNDTRDLSFITRPDWDRAAVNRRIFEVLGVKWPTQLLLDYSIGKKAPIIGELIGLTDFGEDFSNGYLDVHDFFFGNK